MRAEDIKLEEIVEFSEGLLSLRGRRLVLHDIHALAHLRKDLIEMVGEEQACQVLTRFGYFWGQADAAATKRIFNMEDVREWIKAGPRMQSLQGVARAVIQSSSIDQEGRFEMEVAWYDSGEAEEHLVGVGKSEYPVCWILTGYASGYVSFCLGRKIYFIEQSCRAHGDQICVAVGKDESSWGKEIEPYLRYFRAEDVQGKILHLTQVLKEKTQQLIEQRKQIDRLERKIRPFYIEVRSKSFQQVLDLAGRAAQFDSSVLITGETGSGKEVIARYIHRLSQRSEESFLAVNCGALPETLAESELFGHKSGAFTGAIRDRIGLFEQANGGTIFLDEIGDVPQSIQVKILRVLQEKEILRIGESKTRKVDVRIIAATNRDIEQEIAQGRFRDDLYYRLNVIEIKVPSLRDRKMDILPLSRYFVKRVSKKLKIPELKLDPSCFTYLLSYPWPGNVRELENALERSAVVSRDGVIFPEHLPPNIVNPDALSTRIVDPLKCSLEQMEEDHIKNVLKLVSGNRTRAAKILGIGHATLWRKLKSYGMEEDKTTFLE